MNYIARPKDFKSWVVPAYEKIIATINSCETLEQLKVAKTMVSNFIFIAALEEDSEEESLEKAMGLFWTLINLKKLSLK